MENKVKPDLIYIASDVRSGSTLLDLMLGSHSEISSVGEIQFLTDHFRKQGMGQTWDWKCTCGKDFNDCEFWSKINSSVIEKTGDDISSRDTWVRRVRQPFVYLMLPNFLFKTACKNKSFLSKGMDASAFCWDIVDSISEQTGNSIIVDSSKNAEQFRYLHRWRPSSLKIIHLIRDGRGVVYSKMTRAGDSSRKATKNWVLENLKISLVKKIVKDSNKITIKYEDLCKDPKREIQKIFEFLNVSNENDLLSKEARHNVCGSPHRFDWKNVEVNLDERWKESLSSEDRKTFNVFGGWLNRIYGYK
jgi:hypothetical protein